MYPKFFAAYPCSSTTRLVPKMSASTSEFVTLVSNDGFEFIIRRQSAYVAGTIKRMLDPTSSCFSFFALDPSEDRQAENRLGLNFARHPQVVSRKPSVEGVFLRISSTFCLIITSGCTSLGSHVLLGFA